MTQKKDVKPELKKLTDKDIRELFANLLMLDDYNDEHFKVIESNIDILVNKFKIQLSVDEKMHELMTSFSKQLNNTSDRISNVVEITKLLTERISVQRDRLTREITRVDTRLTMLDNRIEKIKCVLKAIGWFSLFGIGMGVLFTGWFTNMPTVLVSVSVCSVICFVLSGYNISMASD